MIIRPFIYFINITYFDSASVEFWKLWKDAYEYVRVSPSTLRISVLSVVWFHIVYQAK